MSVAAYIMNDSNVRLWELPSRTRYHRLLMRRGVQAFPRSLSECPPHHSLLLIRGDYLVDERILAFLLQHLNVFLTIQAGEKSVPVAAHVNSALALSTWNGMQTADARELVNLTPLTLNDLSISFSNELKSVDPPYVFPIREDNQVALEEHLFAGSYKGVTDLVTKFLWPVPAKWATRLCAKWKISPNQVTSASLIFVLAVGVLFSYGMWFWGLVLGWVMTFLDTVDGKLARVTVTSSKWGDIFDHGIDLIHPPFWYLAWGMGLTAFAPVLSGLTVNLTIGIILIGYIIGRLVEGIFEWRLGGFAIFCWRPLDSYFRLITARRNPNLIILTGSFILGRPDLGLEAVAFWTIGSTIILVVRLFMAAWEKTRMSSLTSWLTEIDPVNRESLAVRIFTNPPATFK